MATLSNAMVPGQDDPRELYGNYFFGDRGILLVNRVGYEVKPYRPATTDRGGRGQTPQGPPPIEAKKVRDPSGMSEVADSAFGSATHRHVRNFLDSIKSRRKPVCDIEIGFNSTLPCLLAIVSVKEGRTVRWNGRTVQTT
ncbi:MAG: hypothetical protein HYZ58_03840 [Acidobacteria bacterium]|nr:hypothetical protein [Acidobacteriota bacterium]MBI3262267.1 hypothetical protein [Acidobacteriota bacterium]